MELDILQALQTFTKETLDAIDTKIKDSPSTIIVHGRVIEILGDNKYLIRINNGNYIAKSRFTYTLGSAVYAITTNKMEDIIIIY